MRSFARVFSLIVLSLFAASCQTPKHEPPKDPQNLVDQRVAIMKTFIAGLGASSQYAQGKQTAAAAKAKLDIARSGAERLDELFAPGTALGDRGVTKSRALSTIFAKNSDFGDKLRELRSAFTELDGALTRDSKTEAATAAQRTKSACLSCHTKYRTPDE